MLLELQLLGMSTEETYAALKSFLKTYFYHLTSDQLILSVTVSAIFILYFF